MNEVIEKIKNWAFGAFVAVAFALTIIGALGQCSKPVPTSNGQRVHTVLQVRHDTITKIEERLKKQIVYVDTGRIEYVHDTLDRIVPPIGDENVCIAENQLRQCVKCQDSLVAYKDRAKVDSIALDSVAKIAKTVPDTIEKAPSILDRAKDFCVGVLVGAGLRSLF